MSGLCGWAGYTADEESRRRLLARMAEALSAHDGSEISTRCSVGCGIAVASLRGNASVHEAKDLHVAIAGRPAWNDKDLAELAAREGHASALATAYAARGVRLLDVLGGFFALAVVREGDWNALLATDRFGTIPLDYAFRHGCLVFGTHGEALQAHPRVESEIDPQALFSYFFQATVAAPGTVRKHHRRLLPGHRLVLKNGKIAVEPYFRQEITEERRPLPEAEEEFRSLVGQAVERAARDGDVGAFLSGGTDSSTVAGMLTKVLGRPARTYSMGFEAQGYDEMEYARCAAKHFGTDHHEYYVTPEDVLEIVPRIAEVHADPFANESAVPTFCCARLAAKDGVGRMLAGDGGDELFGGNERYATQGLFERYGRVPGFLRVPLEAILRMVPFGERIWPVRKARSYVRQAKTPLPDRMHEYNLVLRLGARNIFTPQFLDTVDTEAPMRLARHIWSASKGASYVNRMLAYDWKFTLADNDLPKVSRSCELAGVEVSYPLLTDEIAAFAAKLPTDWKVKGKHLRWFFKRALRDFLPEKILRKPKHGFGLPFGVWLRTHKGLQQLCGESLSDLKLRNIVRPAFVDEVLKLHRDDHATFYGVMVWRLIMLEQWFRVHERQPAQVK
ncbi:MAG TPA: asparagine synthase C-terminal domain-containing protein [Planctomycetota bacterium]|nr:asparagine synthase C-terminal domain-containing protein [Planctomycetota bacterium]